MVLLGRGNGVVRIVSAHRLDASPHGVTSGKEFGAIS
jgi:hypothetical protein